MQKKIFITSDHAGFEMKEALEPFLSERGFEIDDLGPNVYDSDDDYSDYMLLLAQKVAQNKDTFGIGIGASGQGEAMAVNRVKGARAAVYYGMAAHAQVDSSGKELNMLASTRAHNDANILCLAARFMTIDEAKGAVLLWLDTPFSGDERHKRRIEKLDA